MIDAPVPDPARLVIPGTTALVHENTGVGVVLLLRILYVFETLLHQLTVEALVTTAVGLTVTLIFFGVPLQPFTAGVIIYVTKTGSVVEFWSVSVIEAPAPDPGVLRMPGTAALVHV